MVKYLYGAAVQGIQSFIFKTNELKDIAGASELVENICTRSFEELLQSEKGNDETRLGVAAEKVISAAGNVKYVFNNRDYCARIVRKFPKKVMLEAPGITISQAVVRYDKEEDFGRAVLRLEEKLREERNHPLGTVKAGLLGMERARQTGLPIVEKYKGEYVDAATRAKLKANDTPRLCAKSFYGNPFATLPPKRVAYDISGITGKNDWIAIIHADGNGLGKIVRKIGEKKDEYRDFSERLDEATIASAKEAYDEISAGQEWKEKGRIPIRPVVLGGDDMTVIIRGDLAIAYTEAYLKAFEKNTGLKMGRMLADNNVFDDGRTCLTACAGVAFVKSSFPFYYAYNLAEELCTEAKAKSGRKQSCLMFHKVQDSFITNYKDIVARELTLKTEDGKAPKAVDSNVSKPVDSNAPESLQCGPYFIGKSPEEYLAIEDLMEATEKLNGQEGVRTGLRQWLTLLKEGSGRSQQHLKRLRLINQDDPKAMPLIDKLSRLRHNNTIAAGDCLTLYTILFQETKSKEENV